MSRVIVTVIDGTKARFLTLEPSDIPTYELETHLVEHEGLTNVAKEMQGEELWSSTKPGRNRGSSGQAHSYDDGRESHMIEFGRRFAQAIAAKIAGLIQASQAQQLILVAEPQTLGLMREALAPILPKTLKMTELAKDLCHLKPHELQEYLVGKELLPASIKNY
jgi:protein required for attachment to host cells